MSYQNALNKLPKEVIELIQNYVQGEYLYIPKKESAKKNWGDNSGIKQELKDRNVMIFADWQEGLKVKDLADKYFLSEKSIQRIVLNEKREKQSA